MTDCPWTHPAIAGKHVVSMTRDYLAGVADNVATCRCGWGFRINAFADDCRKLDAAIDLHWLEIIAASEGMPS